MTQNGNTASWYLIDSSLWIQVLRRSPVRARYIDRIDALLANGQAATSGPVRVELLRGARGDADFRTLDTMLSGLAVLPVTEAACSLAGRIGFGMRRQGVTAPAIDLLIAAVAIQHDAVLLHRDADFTTIAAYSELRAERLE